jgi:hypothetical protein
MPFSPELWVMAAPGRAYAAALAARPTSGWRFLKRPAVVALVLGAAIAFGATGHLTLGLLASGVLCWSFVVLIQMATAAAIMRPAERRSMPLSARLDLWFLGHAPWSLWILGATTLLGTAPVTRRVEWPIILSSVIPMAWTSVIAAAFCRVVLSDSRERAIIRTAVHQSVTWTVALVYVAWAVALWPRILAFLGAE